MEKIRRTFKRSKEGILMSMRVTLDFQEPIIYRYEGEVEITGKNYPFQVNWNNEMGEVVSIDWAIMPSEKLMKAEKRITQLVSKVIKEDAKIIIV
jgi:hypothetical protein